jgi:hypothetical protein
MYMRMSSFIRRSHDMTHAEPPLRIEATVGRTMRLARLKRRITLIMTGRFDHILYALWVRSNRLDFANASLEELGHSSERSVFHHTSGGAELAQVLRCVDIPEGSRALDLGSGKGGAACTLAGFPFEEILGVKLSERLIRIAEANIRKLDLKKCAFCLPGCGSFHGPGSLYPISTCTILSPARSSLRSYRI